MKAKRTILIAGHGYVGQPLAAAFAEQGDNVLALSKTVAPDEKPAGYILQSCDLGNAQEIEELDISPDLVIHCASSNRGGADAYRIVFERGIRNLCQSFPEAHIALTSSTSVYAQVDGSVVTETSPATPDRETSQILRDTEDFLIQQQGTPLRLAGIYGPGRSVHLKKFLNGSATIESGEVSRYLNQIHRDDIVSAILHLTRGEQSKNTQGEIFNVGDATPVTQRECYETLAEIFNRPIPPEAAPNMSRKRAWTNKRLSIEKLQATGWQPKYPSFFNAVQNDPKLVDSIRAQIEAE